MNPSLLMSAFVSACAVLAFWNLSARRPLARHALRLPFPALLPARLRNEFNHRGI